MRRTHTTSATKSRHNRHIQDANRKRWVISDLVVPAFFIALCILVVFMLSNELPTPM
ncbi:MAG: hypothetical protein HZC28_05440 [Spirochaetes bacterium]|nr:hypothetical protein [Spirochaetota bacterium]